MIDINREHSPWILHIVAEAMRQDFRIIACEFCAGPRIFSKVHPKSRCMVCGTSWEEISPAPLKTRQKCKRCKKFTRQVIKSPYCAGCREKVLARKKLG